MRTEKIKAEIAKLLVAYQDLDRQWTAAQNAIGLDIESEFGRAVWAMFDGWMTALENAMGDQGYWLSWFIHDNQCGKRGLSATINGESREIRTLDDLVWCITAYRETAA